ncbi:MBL fold metallo-hydrolase [Pseudomonas sp. URMO17WK12:I11]|uniref:MBL fold metallo-hydrolase n=1 Tax=Pseudomonas sp. URMO17WK12:I11 TaxID=1283291 RepID=UPI0011A458EA|nr:MBL fold metallo-hydrolase [Pseudomonas sp. URMO17WK12:I11]
MDLQFLGTSSGVPTKSRNVSATAVIETTGKRWYLVDCGEGTQHQLLRSALSLHDLRGIFITHVHGDHCFGLPGLLASAAMAGRSEALDVVLPAALHDWLRLSLSATATCLPFALQLLAVEDMGQWRSDALAVDTVQLSHRVPSLGFVFTETAPNHRLDTQRLQALGIPRGPLWGELARGLTVQHAGQRWHGRDFFQASRPPQRVIVCGDNDNPGALADLAQDVDVLVHEATYTRPIVARNGNAFGHSTAASIAHFAEQARVRNLVLTHFSARYQADPRRSPCIDDVRNEARQFYTGHLTLARDLQRYHLGRNGQLTLAD